MGDSKLHFDFPPFPTSYLRLTAHRVAQHYGLATVALDNNNNGSSGGGAALDGSDNIILVTKTAAESRFPCVSLSEIIPVKQPENGSGRPEGFKIAIKARPKRGSGCGVGQVPTTSDSEDAPLEGNNTCVNRNEPEVAVSSTPVDAGNRESGRTSRVAIIRDREKDRYDPDYDRSYDRYVRVIPNPMPMHVAFHDGGFLQMPGGHQANLHYEHPVMSPFINSPAGYTPWPNSPAMNYAQSLHGPDAHLFRHPSASNP
ncbi:Single-stranded nucleic acid binding R3H protein [Raphanus sativus]|nr:Single-stranded nucleic acid binding R3H protein [Raphanus sativus]